MSNSLGKPSCIKGSTNNLSKPRRYQPRAEMTCRSRKAQLRWPSGSLVCSASRASAVPRSPAKKKRRRSTKPALISKAVTILLHTKASKVQGRVTFTQTDGTMHVHGEIYRLAPGDHGFHIHEFGVWSEDGLAAGGHYNPTHEMHAGIDMPKRDIGDLGNITANENDKATVDLDDPSLSFYGPTSIIGRGVVVDEKADDSRLNRPATLEADSP